MSPRPVRVSCQVRELRAVVAGPMLIARFGTCGGLLTEVAEGTVVVASLGAVLVTRDPDAAADASHAAGSAYRISRPCPPDAALSAAVLAALQVT